MVRPDLVARGRAGKFAAGAYISGCKRAEVSFILMLTGSCGFATLTTMGRKDDLIQQLRHTAQSMVQGSLSEFTRQCGDPSCACAHDPAHRHGPHLYLKFKAGGKGHSVYVPAPSAAAVKSAHGAWLRFQEMGAQIAATNRAQLLRDLERQKKKKKRKAMKARGEAERGGGQARD
jgi:hypothetical protein